MKTPMPEPVHIGWASDGKAPRFGYTADQLRAAMVAAYNEAIEDVIGLLEGGSFLHEDAPAARMVRVVIPAIRTLKEIP